MRKAYNSSETYTYVLVFQKGDSFKESFLEFLQEEGIKSAFFYGLGGLLDAEIAFYDLEGKQEYLTKELEGPFEVSSITGNVSVQDGELSVHSHVTLGRDDYSSLAGHLVDGTVGGTLEIRLEVLDGDEDLEREFNEETGLDLLK